MGLKFRRLVQSGSVCSAAGRAATCLLGVSLLGAGLAAAWLAWLPVAAAQEKGGDGIIPLQVKGVAPCPHLHGPAGLAVAGHGAVEVQVKMDVDVDGAPNAYGPAGRKTLDVLKHALAPASDGHPGRVVGYMTDFDGGPPTRQRRGDPYPGYYVSQTDFADLSNPRKEDPRRYVDASRINYVVEGRVAEKAGVAMGDFASVYSCRTGKTAYAIVADSGNDSGAEGSLALVRALGYNIRDGVEDSVDDAEIVIRYFPHTNPEKQFFKSQAALNQAAEKLGLKAYGQK